MIVSRDINSTKETESIHMLIDVIGRYREEFNKNEGDVSRYELEIPYPEEFIQSPNTKYVRVISTSILFKGLAADEPFWNVEENGDGDIVFEGYTLNHFPDDILAQNNFTADYNTQQPYHLAIGSTFIQDTTNDNQLIGICNPDSTQYLRTYEQHTTQKSFKIWIVDLLQRVKMNLYQFAKKKASILLELELVY